MKFTQIIALIALNVAALYSQIPLVNLTLSEAVNEFNAIYGLGPDKAVKIDNRILVALPEDGMLPPQVALLLSEFLVQRHVGHARQTIVIPKGKAESQLELIAMAYGYSITEESGRSILVDASSRIIILKYPDKAWDAASVGDGISFKSINIDGIYYIITYAVNAEPLRHRMRRAKDDK